MYKTADNFKVEVEIMKVVVEYGVSSIQIRRIDTNDKLLDQPILGHSINFSPRNQIQSIEIQIPESGPESGIVHIPHLKSVNSKSNIWFSLETRLLAPEKIIKEKVTRDQYLDILASESSSRHRMGTLNKEEIEKMIALGATTLKEKKRQNKMVEKEIPIYKKIEKKKIITGIKKSQNDDLCMVISCESYGIIESNINVVLCKRHTRKFNKEVLSRGMIAACKHWRNRCGR